MKHRASIVLGVLAWSSVGQAQEAHVHASAAAAHAVGPPQSQEFGSGGGASAAVEMKVSRAVGLQVAGGALVLAKGDRVSDPALAASSTGAALFGTAGVRVHLLGTATGPWIDANAGVTRTGALVRPTADAHVGWALPLSRSAGIHAGPVLGYMHVLQPDAELRGGDARVLTAGFAVTFGAKDIVRPAAPPRDTARRSPPPDRDGTPETTDLTVAAAAAEDEHASVRLVEDRILLDDVIEFEFDSARIRHRSHPLVQKIARFLEAREGLLEVSIEGHADAVGTESYNQRLSEARAESTRALLVAFGVDASRLVVVAHGASHLKVPTPLPNARNRRVELFVTRVHEEAAMQPGATSGHRGEP